MAEGSWTNPLSSFQEMGTLPKVLLLLGFIFLSTALLRGASFSDPMLPVSLALISLSLVVHFFSESRKTVTDGMYSSTVTDKGKMWGGIVLSVVTIVLMVWAALISARKPKAENAPSTEISKPTDVPATQKESKDEPATTPVKTTPKRSKPSTGKNQTSGNETKAAGDNSVAVGYVTQGPCSVSQAGGSNNQATTNCVPQPRIPTSSVQSLAEKLSSCKSGSTRAVPRVVNPVGTTSLDAGNLASAFAKSQSWSYSGVNVVYKGQDIGDDGPIPDTVGIHIVANTGKRELAQCVSFALKSIGVDSVVEIKDLNGDILDIIVGNTQSK
jgi:hypothetical protein